MLLLLMITNLITPVRLLMGRRWLMLTGAVELLLLTLRRRTMRMFRTAGYGTGTAAVIGRAVHRSVVHGGSKTRVRVLPRRNDETLCHVLVASDTVRVPDVQCRHCVRLLANIAVRLERRNVNRFNAC